MSKGLIGALSADRSDNVTKTENSMPAFKSTLNACLDLFFLGGSYRERTETETISLFRRAHRENPELALRIVAYIRDAREGNGEREFFRRIIRSSITDSFNISYIPVIGRWDDVLCLIGTPLEKEALDLIATNLTGPKPDGLCAKWMPRKGREARILREHMKLYPKDYRKLLVKLTKVVETQMCSSDWKGINYSHVPSVANIKYNAAFLRHDEDRRREFLGEAKKGNVKINSKVAFPHDIVAMMLPSTRYTLHDRDTLARYVSKNETAIAMWAQLPNVLSNPERRLLVCCDTSNSMRRPHSMTDNPFHISLAMSIYFSERLKGPFQNAFITFSGSPTLQYTEGDLFARLCAIRALNPANTNLERVFRLVLDTANKNAIKEGEMPTDIMIISDMEFDRAVEYPTDSVFALIRKQYADAGYDMPNIIFWNVNARNDHAPVQRNSKGVALISGASPNAIKAVMDGVVTPLDVMLAAVNTERYEGFIKQAI